MPKEGLGSSSKKNLQKLSKFLQKVMIQRAKDFYNELNVRRNLRNFSNKKIPQAVIDFIILTAGTTGDLNEPWAFVVVVKNLNVTKTI
jgi:hypothetical protein